jgi:hypothetical protein
MIKLKTIGTPMTLRMDFFALAILCVLIVSVISVVAPTFAVSPLEGSRPNAKQFKGELHVASMSRESAPKINMRTFDGSTWRVMAVSNPEKGPFSPSMTTNPETKLYLVTIRALELPKVSLSEAEESNIMIRVHDGREWTSPTPGPSFTNQAFSPAVAYFNGKLFLIWEDRTGDVPIIRGSAYDGTTGWMEEPFTVSEGHGMQPTAVVHGNNLHVVYADSEWKLRHSHSIDGINWPEQPSIINPQPSSPNGNPHLAVHDDELHLAYNTEGSLFINLQKWSLKSTTLAELAGYSWSAAYLLTDSKSDPWGPTICSLQGSKAKLYCLYRSWEVSSEPRLVVNSQWAETLEDNDWSLPSEVPMEVTPEDAMNDLITDVEGLGLSRGLENSLLSKLEDATHLLNMGNENGARHKLGDFINQVERQRDKKISNEDTYALIGQAQWIIDNI